MFPRCPITGSLVTPSPLAPSRSQGSDSESSFGDDASEGDTPAIMSGTQRELFESTAIGLDL